MKGLLLKDFYIAKNFMRSYIILGIVFLFIGILNKNPIFVVSLLLFSMNLNFPTAFFSLDDAGKWDFMCTMPLSRKKIVLSRYIMIFLSSMIGLVISGLCGYVVALLHKQTLDGTFFLILLALFSLCLLINSVLIPLIYTIGLERARFFSILIFIVVIAFAVLVGFLLFSIIPQNTTYERTADVQGIPSHVVTQQETSNAIFQQFMPFGFLFPVVSMVGYALSYWISSRIFSKKEFI